MFVLKIYNSEVGKTRETRLDDYEKIKNIISKLYKDFVYSYPELEVSFSINDFYGENPLSVSFAEINHKQPPEMVEIDVYRVSETEVNNEQFFKDLGINLDN